MAVVRTDLRTTRQRAKEIAYYPTSTLTGRNVQDAIDQLAASSMKPPAIVPTPISFANSPYTVLPTDYLILVDTAGGAVTINMMPAAARGNIEVEIKDSTGHAQANNISVVGNGAETSDGLATYPIASDFAAFRFKPVAGGYKVI